MKALRIRQARHRNSNVPFCGSYCTPWTIIYLDDRGAEAPGAICIIIYNAWNNLDLTVLGCSDVKVVDFVIDGGKYTGWFQKTRDHEYTISQVSSLS